MFYIDEDQVIHITRGDEVNFSFTATNDEEVHLFRVGDVIRFKVVEKKACENVMLQKDFAVEADTEFVSITLDENDTKIGEIISRPTDYWYEVELNPFTEPQTILGYDEYGAKIFRLYPEGADIEPKPIEPEDIPVVDDELDMTSKRPIQNRVVATEIAVLKAAIATVDKRVEESKKYSGITETTSNKLDGSFAGGIRFKTINGVADQSIVINKISAKDGKGNENSAVLSTPIELNGDVAVDFEMLQKEDYIAILGLTSYDGATYLEFDSEIAPEINVEYGISELGALALENSNLHMVNEILRENQITKADFTVDGGTLILNWL